MHAATIKRALISVSDKQGLIPFAKQLHEFGIELLSTGGTYSALREANIPAMEVSTRTGFPEIMDGRVKTLHPRIHGGILGRRTVHAEVAKTHGIDWIDLVVVNLYPFSKTIQDTSTPFEAAIEQIDIGGPAMIRSAAKNMESVTVIVDPSDYDTLIHLLGEKQEIDFDSRKSFARKAFKHTCDYDAVIYDYLGDKKEESTSEFPTALSIPLTKKYDLRYGENPDQKACVYTLDSSKEGLLDAIQHQGKVLSYNNLVDADAAQACVEEFAKPACVIIKHANPCAIAQASSPLEAFLKAWSADSLSAFGGIVALNRSCDTETAQALSKQFFEVILAPSFSLESLEIFSKKPNLRILELGSKKQNLETHWQYQSIEGGVLVQEKISPALSMDALTYPTKRKPTDAELQKLLFAWRAVKHVKSNAIVITSDTQTMGIGAGQVSRVDAVELAIRKASGPLDQAVLASDAFFPFRDSIDRIAAAGIQGIIQPGGSIRDAEVIEACDTHNIVMIFTGTRCFRH